MHRHPAIIFTCAGHCACKCVGCVHVACAVQTTLCRPPRRSVQHVSHDCCNALARQCTKEMLCRRLGHSLELECVFHEFLAIHQVQTITPCVDHVATQCHRFFMEIILARQVHRANFSLIFPFFPPFSPFFAVGIWCMDYRPLSPLFTLFFFNSTTSTPSHVDSSPPWVPREGISNVTILTTPHPWHPEKAGVM